MLQPVLCANGWAVVQRDFEERELHDNHEAGLQKERVAVVRPEPVEDPGSPSFQYFACDANVFEQGALLEDRGHEHNKGDVKREAIAASGAMDREDLISVRCYRGEDEATRKTSATALALCPGEAAHNKGAKLSTRSERICSMVARASRVCQPPTGRYICFSEETGASDWTFSDTAPSINCKSDSCDYTVRANSRSAIRLRRHLSISRAVPLPANPLSTVYRCSQSPTVPFEETSERPKGLIRPKFGLMERSVLDCAETMQTRTISDPPARPQFLGIVETAWKGS